MTTTTHPQAAPDAAPAQASAPASARPWLVELFVVYLALLAWVVLWKLDVPWVGSGARRTVKLVPFVHTAANGPSQPAEVLANVLLFVPFGLYLRLIAPRLRWWWAVGVVAGASVGLEVAQYVLAVGSSDVSDVIANTAGGLVGIVLVSLVRLALRARAATALTGAVTVVTLLALLVSALFVASPVHYGGRPPGDGQHHVRLDRQAPPLDAPG